MNSISENEIEGIALSYLHALGYQYLNGLVMSPDGEHPERQYKTCNLKNYRMHGSLYKNPH